MNRTRLLTLLLALALAFATASAVTAQDDGTESTFEPASVEEWNEDEALILYQQLQERLLAMGVAEEDMSQAVDYLAETFGNLSEADVDELLAAQMLSESEAETGDDEFGQSEEDEPELGDDETGDEDEEDE